MCTFTNHSTNCTGCIVDGKLVYHAEEPLKYQREIRKEAA